MKNLRFIFIMLLSVGCAYNVNDHMPSDPNVYYAGGDGLSFEQAVYFPGIKSSKQAKPLKEKWLAEKYPGYKKESQGVVIHNSKMYDRIKITAVNGEAKTVHFDLTTYLGRARDK